MGAGWIYRHMIGKEEGVLIVIRNVCAVSLDAWISENNYSGDVAP